MLDTIFALATAQGKAGVSVIRISGPKSHAALGMMASVPELRKASVRKLYWDDVLLDEALVIAFGEGASFTGEESVELHVHGSRATINAILNVLIAIPGLRPAEAGEFTRRALENGMLDLTQVEGLADLIDAETEAQRIQSLRVLSGAIGKKVDAWRQKIIRAGALLEATIDFADEDIPVDVMPEVKDLLSELIVDFEAEISGVKMAEQIREGFEVAIVGRPNVGKSTLLNALSGRKAALTSEIAGTTRDVIEVRMDIDGLAVTFLDTAGIRETGDQLEAMGVNLAIERANAADLRVFLTENGDRIDEVEFFDEDITALGKLDSFSGDVEFQADHRISGLTGEGIGALLSNISSILQQRISGAGLLTRERHRVAIQNGLIALRLASDEVFNVVPTVELAAEELRSASQHLELLLGEVGVETLLGEIFSSFCIGK
ncbi:tRNA uridine-5-carboxymethylaminomethyl(34) synthesis GTPase MnmE [Pseudorhodobacter aquimaris]|uniref:tRNA uridine-5-carboxymethylaminomethyl(34) synthesis GTPase MnmE n=1 Tax=Pseudorhodobacter aquimaris TaxID=687412 RepID=UPI00067AF5C5|nr:tRNA uridine-5-carboxymethylaminomethyl(34) synthesis GTPase MnmE [Pseudorhodobacter aquimaris]